MDKLTRAFRGSVAYQIARAVAFVVLVVLVIVLLNAGKLAGW